MPAGDRTGPEGMGAMTGRSAGLCAGHDTPGYLNRGPGRGRGLGRGGGRGFGRGRGRGRGRGWRYGREEAWVPDRVAGPVVSPASPASGAGELRELKAQADALARGLAAIQARIGEIESREPGPIEQAADGTT